MGSLSRVRGAGSTIVRAMENLLLPRNCVLCSSDLQWTAESEPPLCPKCRNLPFLAGVRCEQCGRPLISEIRICTTCRQREFAFDTHFSLFRYRGDVRKLIRLFKFRGVRDLSTLFSSALAAVYREQWQSTPLVPVPARRSSVRARGFDPVGLITDQIAQMTEAPVLRLLARKNGKSQKTLDYSGRIVNLQGQISLRRSTRTRRTPFPPTVLLVDDVFTTGATAHECARVLKEAGVQTVRILTIAMD